VERTRPTDPAGRTTRNLTLLGRGSFRGRVTFSLRSLSIGSESLTRDWRDRVPRIHTRLRDAGSCCRAHSAQCFREHGLARLRSATANGDGCRSGSLCADISETPLWVATRERMIGPGAAASCDYFVVRTPYPSIRFPPTRRLAFATANGRFGSRAVKLSLSRYLRIALESGHPRNLAIRNAKIVFRP
jgi:hypothetical protein